MRRRTGIIRGRAVHGVARIRPFALDFAIDDRRLARDAEALMAARYLLDTDTCVYSLERREPRIVRRVQAHAHHAAISVITLSELEFGRAGSSDPGAVREAIDLLRETFCAASSSDPARAANGA
jgi:hypothetical protein